MAVLRGFDHPELGRVARWAFGDDTGIAISAGSLVDERAHLDPNEDGAFAARRDDATVLAVVDGNGGANASDAALTWLADEFDQWSDPIPEDRSGWLFSLRDQAMRAASNARRQRPRAHASDTALSLAAVIGSTVSATSLGDTGVVVVSRRVEVLSGIAPHLDHLAVPALTRQTTLTAGGHVIVATDGFFDALGPRWVDMVRTVLQEFTASKAAAALVEEACAAGADDNISVAVTAVPGGPAE